MDTLTILFVVQSANIGYLDAIVDGLIVQASKNENIKNGAEKFQTLTFIMQGTGAIMGGIFASSLLDTVYEEPLHDLRIYVIFNVLLLIVASFLGSDAEPK